MGMIDSDLEQPLGMGSYHAKCHFCCHDATLSMCSSLDVPDRVIDESESLFHRFNGSSKYSGLSPPRLCCSFNSSHSPSSFGRIFQSKANCSGFLAGISPLGRTSADGHFVPAKVVV